MSNVRDQDKLNSFSNPIPSGFLNDYDAHLGAVADIGLHSKFKNNAMPINPLMPSIIQVYLKKLVINPGPYRLSMFDELDCFHLDPHRGYTPKQLHEYLTQTVRSYTDNLGRNPKGYISRYHEEDKEIRFSQYDYNFDDFDEDWEQQYHITHLFFHENFAHALDLFASEPGMRNKGVKIDDDLYYDFSPGRPGAELYCSSTRSIVSSRPNMIQITCDSAQHSMVEQTKLPLLKRMPLTIKVAADAEFWVHTFKRLDWVPLNPDCAHLISIKLLDEHGNKVRLTPGYPTYITLKIRSFPPILSSKLLMNPSKRFSVHISSTPTDKYPKNEPHHFFVDLPNTLKFPYGKWQVALTHVTYPSQMRILPSFNFSLTVSNYTQGAPRSRWNMELPTNVTSCEAIIDIFKTTIKDVADVLVWNDGKLQINFKQDAKLELGSSLAYILGDPNSKLYVADNKIIDSATLPTLMYFFKERPKFVQLYPASIFLYSKNLCQYSLVGSRKLPILSIINHQSQKDNLFHNNEVEIMNPNFIKITQTEVTTLEFFMYAHDDNPIRFIDPNGVVFMTLAFEKPYIQNNQF